MAVTQTNRLNLYRWSSGADQFTRAQMTESHDNLDSSAAGYSQGDLPTGDLTNYVGFFHYTSGTSDAGTLYYCNGLEWFPIGNYGAASSLDGSLSDGISANVARADHTHSLDDDIISTSKIVNSAVTSDKISDSSVITSKIAAGAVDNSKLASDLDASKLTAGTLPVARIATGSLETIKLADNAVTAAKLRDSSALSVVGNPTNLTADPSDIVADIDGHILRRSGTSIGFGTILSANISDLTESVQDIAGGMVDGGTETGITVTYNDTSGKLNFTVNDDGHNHIISNVDGLQTALDGKVSDTGDTITGTLTVGGTSQYLRFKDTTDNSHYGQFASSLTGNRTYTFPDYDGTVVMSSHVGNLDVTGDIYVGTSGGGDSRIFFHDDNSNTERTLFWDDAANDWRVEDSGGTTRVLYHSGNIPSYAASSHSHSYLSTSGGTVSGNITVTGYIINQGPFYVGKNGGGDSWVNFYDDNSNAWRQFGWDDSANQFYSGGSLQVAGTIDVTGDMYVGTANGGDSRIYFHDDNSNVERVLFWDDSVNDWRVTDNGGTVRVLYHSGNIPSYASSSHSHSYAAVSHSHDYAASSHSHNYLSNSNGYHYGTLFLTGAGGTGSGILQSGGVTSNGQGIVRVGTNNANNTNFVADTNHGGLSGAYYVFSIYHYGSNKGSIAHNGSTTSYNTTSDYRIKENIVDLNDGLSVVNSMRPRRFTFKDNPNDTRVHTGFIAHELQEVMPEIVIGEKDAMEEDGVTIKPQVVDKSGVVAVLVSAVQELSARTEALEAQLASM